MNEKILSVTETVSVLDPHPWEKDSSLLLLFHHHLYLHLLFCCCCCDQCSALHNRAGLRKTYILCLAFIHTHTQNKTFSEGEVGETEAEDDD